MLKQDLLEMISLMIDEEISQLPSSSLVKEDEALKMSDKRRRIFKQEIMSNPVEPTPVKLKEGQQDLIGEEGILPDKAPPPPAPGGPPPAGDTAPVDAPGMGGPQSAPMPAGDVSMDPGAGTLNAPGGDAGGGAPGEEPPPMDDAGGPPPDMDGGGGIGGGFGGGGGGGGGMDDMGGDEAEDSDMGDKPEPSSINPFEGAETTGDRLNVILTKAEELAQTTQDPHIILKDVKGLIQNGFSKPQEAAGLIADLFDTETPVLQQVSRLLAQYALGI